MKIKKQNLRDQIFSKTQDYYNKNRKLSAQESKSVSESDESIDYQSKKMNLN